MKAPDLSRPRPLGTEEEYDAALARIRDLLHLDPAEGSPEDEELEFWSILVNAYEAKHYPIEAATPQEVVQFMLEQRGMERADLYNAMGGASRVSEFFSGKRDLSLSQVRALRNLLGIPADLLIGAAERSDPSVASA